MRALSFFFLLLSFFLLSACANLTKSAKYGLADGYYKAITKERKDASVYVYTSEDTLVAYMAEKGKEISEKSPQQAVIFPETSLKDIPPTYIFKEYSFDLDVLTIPFKYRGPEKEMERQLTTQFNGALYAGYRTDRYRVSYGPTPLGLAERSIQHYGYSIGLFSGIGAESINPWVTQDQYAGEYEGFVWSQGIAGIIGINNFNVGLGLGFDYLLDSNRKIWIYQRTPWLGLMVGLNLN